MPIITLARFLGKSYFDTWYSVIAGSDEKIYTIAGSPSDRNQEALLAKQSNEIVIDLSGLLTMNYLNLLEKLPVAFTIIKAPLSVLETLKKWKTKVENQEPHPVVWEEDGGLIYREITAEILANRKEVIAKMISFVETHVESLPANKVLTITSENLGKYRQAFGKNFHSVMLANELAVPIYLDDRLLATVFNDLGYQVQPISVQSILLKFQSMGLISFIEYWSLLKQLILANYFFISINTRSLIWMLKDEGNQATDKIKKIIDISLGKFCEPTSAIIVGIEFLHLTCLQVIDQDQKENLVDLTLEAVLSNRNDEVNVSLLKQGLALQFQYSKHLLEFVLERLKLHTTY